MDDRRKGFPIDEVLTCKIEGVSISNFLNFFERETGKIQLDALRPSNMIFAEGFQKALFNRTAKRLFDLVASLLLLAVAWPFMLLAASAIWIESGGRGSILYRQARVGRNDHPFDLIKFRSMRGDAEQGRQRPSGLGEAIVGSPASAASSAKPASMNYRNCSTCCGAT
ncbi:MAG: sugar transferase [Candidatus Competibacteraceae bacterium]|nr:sugar transferase [Candidatus Competibacteraceae bacterium]